MKTLLDFISEVIGKICSVPGIVAILSVGVLVQQNHAAQDRLIAGLIGAIVPITAQAAKTKKTVNDP